MKIQRRKIEREANEATIALAWVIANASSIEERANSDDYAGFGPGITGRSSGVSDPTAAGALRYIPDPGKGLHPEQDKQRQIELAAAQFKDALYEANRAALRAERIGRSLLALPNETKDEKDALKKLLRDSPADSSGLCANPACKVTVLNTPNDRLREGRCEPCYRFRKEHHGNERPRELCHPEQVEVAG